MVLPREFYMKRTFKVMLMKRTFKVVVTTHWVGLEEVQGPEDDDGAKMQNGKK